MHTGPNKYRNLERPARPEDEDETAKHSKPVKDTNNTVPVHTRPQRGRNPVPQNRAVDTPKPTLPDQHPDIYSTAVAPPILATGSGNETLNAVSDEHAVREGLDDTCSAVGNDRARRRRRNEPDLRDRTFVRTDSPTIGNLIKKHSSENHPQARQDGSGRAPRSGRGRIQQRRDRMTTMTRGLTHRTATTAWTSRPPRQPRRSDVHDSARNLPSDFEPRRANFLRALRAKPRSPLEVNSRQR